MSTPFFTGNVWMLSQEDDGSYRFLSDRWKKRVFGFEERNRICLAQSGSEVLGVVAFGGGFVAAESIEPKRYEWHLIDEDIDCTEQPRLAAEIAAEAILSKLDEKNTALPTTLALSQSQPSIREAEALPGSKIREQLLERVDKASNGLSSWNKKLHVAVIHLSLLDGESSISENSADLHYAAVGQSLAAEISALTKQPAFPRIFVFQDCGTRHNGSFETILAEGRLDIMHPALGITVVSPTYWCSLETGAPSMINSHSAECLGWLSAYAFEELAEGRHWHCPIMESAHCKEKVIEARHLSMTDLVLNPGPHGFAFEGPDPHPKIENVEVNGKSVFLHLDKTPDPKHRLTYAFTSQSSKLKNRPANNGSISDEWRARGPRDADLRRWALSSRVRIRGLDE